MRSELTGVRELPNSAFYDSNGDFNSMTYYPWVDMKSWPAGAPIPNTPFWNVHVSRKVGPGNPIIKTRYAGIDPPGGEKPDPSKKIYWPNSGYDSAKAGTGKTALATLSNFK